MCAAVGGLVIDRFLKRVVYLCGVLVIGQVLVTSNSHDYNHNHFSDNRYSLIHTQIPIIKSIHVSLQKYWH